MCQSHSFFLWNHFWATFIDIWRFFSGHTAYLREGARRLKFQLDDNKYQFSIFCCCCCSAVDNIFIFPRQREREREREKKLSFPTETWNSEIDFFFPSKEVFKWDILDLFFFICILSRHAHTSKSNYVECGCGPVGRAVASNSRGSRFKTSRRQNL